MDYCRKARCWLPCGKLDCLCTQEHYAHEPLPFPWPSSPSMRQALTLECTYGSCSRWWHGTASRSFGPLQFPSSIGIPWQSAWCGDPSQLLSWRGLVWSLPSKCLWNAKMKLIVWSSSRKCPIPDLPSRGHPPCLQECPSTCRLRHLLPQVSGHTASPLVPGLPRRSPSYATWRVSMRQPCQLLSSPSPDTSPLGLMACCLQLGGPFRTTRENWIRAISLMVKGIDLAFCMYWRVLRQHPLVMAYRRRTNRDWIIEVTMCCPERTV